MFALRHCLRLFLVLLFIGIIATLGMDLWNVVLYFLAGDALDWHMVGRWLGHILHGDFIYKDVPYSAPVVDEVILGWLGHYFIGLIYTFLYLFILCKLLGKQVTWYTAVLFAWLMMLFPFFLLQPAMDMGLFSGLTPHPWISRLTTLSFHTAFGFSLYLGCRLAKKLFKCLPFEPSATR